MESNNKKITILLLTNRDSDNAGDQVIEASDIGLLHALMKNLGFEKKAYKINSRSASIVTKKYMATREPELLSTAETAISQADIVIFGGAPVFNYGYQSFYERTAVTLEIAQKYGKPVIFSAIGIEAYDENSKKCQRLKSVLNIGCVKQITTRDGLERLEKYNDNNSFKIGLVSDPAVFSSTVFENFIGNKDSSPVKEKKKIGIFVIRANGFIDNNIDFSKEQSAELWLNIIETLKSRGYDYELVTSGHFGDEAYLDYLIREYNVPVNKCVFNINMPETLFRKMSEYDGVISCRLHPSIISFSMNIPAVGLVWNTKVPSFYKGIGYPERAIEKEEFCAEAIVGKLEKAMEEGIEKDQDYLMSVYQSLFFGVKDIVCGKDCDIQPYEYETLLEMIPRFAGTSENEQYLKLTRKFRRAYETCNKRLKDNLKLKERIVNLTENNNKKRKDAAIKITVIQVLLSVIIMAMLIRLNVLPTVSYFLIGIILICLLVYVRSLLGLGRKNNLLVRILRKIKRIIMSILGR